MEPSDRSLSGSPSLSSASAFDESTPLSDDDIRHILRTPRRRAAIRYLLSEDGPIKMCDVAEHVAALEHGTTVSELTATQRQRVYIPLYQSHLPKLDDAGVIEYDKPRGIIYPTDRLERFRPHLDSDPTATTEADADTDRADAADRSGKQRYYGTVIAASVGLLCASAASAVQVPDSTLGVSVTSLFGLAAVANRLDRDSPASANATTDTDASAAQRFENQ